MAVVLNVRKKAKGSPGALSPILPRGLASTNEQGMRDEENGKRIHRRQLHLAHCPKYMLEELFCPTTSASILKFSVVFVHDLPLLSI